ncbi:LysR family transcriptional regulator [Avibacterium paragallinarum]|uniref:LysR family transcriptional regulator n=1 Tax=Avibacterium paragallinarum TaxID=728 RepID=UPI00397936AE
MPKINYNDLYAFYQVAQHQSFSQAANKLGISAPALSKTIRQLEDRLGVQLLHRTTRSVSLTQAGQQFYQHAERSFNRLNQGLAQLEHYRQSPRGVVRINCANHPIEWLLLPKLAPLQRLYPDITLDFISENRFIDIVKEGFDAGIRLGDDVAEDMIAVKISDPLQMTVVASPSYLAQHGIPQHPSELAQHSCIGYRLSNGTVYPWTFQHHGETQQLTPKTQWIFSDDYPARTAAKMGLGLAYLPESMVEQDIARGELIALFPNQPPTLPAFYLYYPNRHISPALRVVVDCLRLTNG